MMTTTRPSWEEFALLQAFAAATRSEDPYRKVGACALDHNHRILGTAYNGLATGKQVDEKFWLDREGRRPYMLHAEVNLMTLFTRGEADIVAVTLKPCSSCAQALAANGVKTLVYCHEYDRDVKGEEILSFYGIKVKRVFPSELMPYAHLMSRLIDGDCAR